MTLSCRRFAPALLAVALLASRAPATNNDDTHLWKLVGDGIYPFVLISELALLDNGKEGKHEAWQGLKTLAAAGATTELLKRAVGERRPTGTNHDSFPSLHATEAFAMAAVIDEYKPKYRWLGYGVAGLISYSRIATKDHHWQDVLAGAAIGYGFGRLFCHTRHVGFSGTQVAYNMSF